MPCTGGNDTLCLLFIMAFAALASQTSHNAGCLLFGQRSRTDLISHRVVGIVRCFGTRARHPAGGQLHRALREAGCILDHAIVRQELTAMFESEDWMMKYRLMSDQRGQHANVQVLIRTDLADNKRRRKPVRQCVVVTAQVARSFDKALIDGVHAAAICRTVRAQKQRINANKIVMLLDEQVFFGLDNASIFFVRAKLYRANIASNTAIDLRLAEIANIKRNARHIGLDLRAQVGDVVETAPGHDILQHPHADTDRPIEPNLAAKLLLPQACAEALAGGDSGFDAVVIPVQVAHLPSIVQANLFCLLL